MWLHTLISVLKIDFGKNAKIVITHIFLVHSRKKHTSPMRHTWQHAFISLLFHCNQRFMLTRCHSVYFLPLRFFHMFLFDLFHILSANTCAIVNHVIDPFIGYGCSVKCVFSVSYSNENWILFFFCVTLILNLLCELWPNWKLEWNSKGDGNYILHSIACPCSDYGNDWVGYRHLLNEFFMCQ